LFFGFLKQDGSLVTTQQWNAFVEQRISPRFPGGLTVVGAYGRCLDSPGVWKEEPSEIVIILYPPDQASTANSNIAAIVAEYCSQFDQESVLRADSVQKTSFPSAKPR
jgi:hypothetical protein